MSELRIDLFADITCPWCYIGEQRLKQALAQRPDVNATIRWRPYLLLPDLGPKDVPFTTFIDAKFGGMEQAQGMFDHVTAIGAADGITFAFDRLLDLPTPNTRNSHRLILLAKDEESRLRLADRLFRAHFTEGENLNSLETLVRIGEEMGMDGGEVRRYLESDENADVVQKSMEEAEQMGISGVPFYIFNEQWALSGAQPLETFVQALDTVTNTPAE